MHTLWKLAPDSEPSRNNDACICVLRLSANLCERSQLRPAAATETDAAVETD